MGPDFFFGTEEVVYYINSSAPEYTRNKFGLTETEIGLYLIHKIAQMIKPYSKKELLKKGFSASFTGLVT